MSSSIPPTPSVNEWSEVLPVTRIGKRRCYFEIPAFSLTDLTYDGAAIIRIVFNYASSKKLTLRNLPVKPSNPDYVPCIKYRLEDGTVYRFKLWEVENDGIFYPVYNGQVILNDFQIEIWGLDSFTTVTNDAVIVINNSILVTRSSTFDASESATTENPIDGDAITDLDNTNAAAPTFEEAFPYVSVVDQGMGVQYELVGVWFAEDAYTQTADQWIARRALVETDFSQAVAGERPTLLSNDLALGDKSYLLFDGVNDNMACGTGTDAGWYYHVMVVQQVTWTDTKSIFSNVTPYAFQDGVTPKVSYGDNFTTDIALGTWYVLEFMINRDNNYSAYIRITNLLTGEQVVSDDGDNNFPSGLTENVQLGDANIKLAAYATYVGNSVDMLASLSSTVRDNIVAYLRRYYCPIDLPLLYTTEQHGEDNS